VEMDNMDPNRRGYITRDDWMKYLCSPLTSGKYIFRGRLKRMFKKFDGDNSGYLDRAEFVRLLNDVFTDHAKFFKVVHSLLSKGQEDISEFKGMISDLCDELMADMNSEDHDTNVI
jgi:Ca2+-binding EF-hand superfamily protein